MRMSPSLAQRQPLALAVGHNMAFRQDDNVPLRIEARIIAAAFAGSARPIEMERYIKHLDQNRQRL